MSLLSVVVPVYNVEDYLDFCLESLEAQTLRDIEVVCVNDGSTDGSRALLGSWARRDDRIKIVDKENGGLSSARNAGILAAHGDYVCFLDSDDRFHPTACETIARTLDETGADVLTFGATCYPESAGYPWLVDVLSPRDVTYDHFEPALLFEERSRPFAWRTACRRAFLIDNDIMFDDGFGEDQVFHFAVYPRASKTVLISDKLYDYRVSREGSLMDRWASDLGGKMSTHVGIVRRILADWERGGLIDGYPADMMAFCMDFVINDTLKLGDASYRRIAGALREVLSRYWSEGDVETMGLEPVIVRMARACYHPTLGPLARKRLVFDYYAFRFGLRAAVAHLLGR